MAIRRRLSADRRIVSHFDPAIWGISDSKLQRYCEMLDIEELGDLSELPERPAIFTIKPLASKFEYLAYSDPPDYWGIFATHVKSVTELDFELQFEDGEIKALHRDDFAPRIVHNVASIIKELANDVGGGDFFTPPASFWGSVSLGKSRIAREAAKMDAGSVAAKINALK